MKKLRNTIKEIFKNARGIYIRDLKAILHNPVAALVVGALVILPSLYAWVNIIACWDPYGNTAGIHVAVVNLDRGVELNGTAINAGDEIVKNLQENHNIGWQFVDRDEAEDGLTRGRYYAMLEIPDNFSPQLVDVLNGNLKRPEIIYRVNEKYNAIAPKITDTGAKTVANQVTQAIIEVVDQAAFAVGNDVGDTMGDNKSKITRLRDACIAVNQNFDEIEAGMDDAEQGLITVNELLGDVSDTLPAIRDGVANLEDFSAEGNAMLGDVETIKVQAVDYLDDKFTEVLDLNDELQKFVLQAQVETTDVKTLQDKIPQIQEKVGKLQSALGEFITLLHKYEDKNIDYAAIVTKLERAQTALTQMNDALDTLKADPGKVRDALREVYVLNGQIIAAQRTELGKTQHSLNAFAELVQTRIPETVNAGQSGTELALGIAAQQAELLRYGAQYPQMKEQVEALDQALGAAVQWTQDNPTEPLPAEEIEAIMADAAALGEEIARMQALNEAAIEKLQQAQEENAQNLEHVDAITDEEVVGHIDTLQGDLTTLSAAVTEAENLVKKLQDKGITIAAVAGELRGINHELDDARDMLSRLDTTMTDGLRLADEAIALVQETGSEVETAVSDLRGAYNARWDSAIEGMLGDLQGSLGQLDHVLANANDALPKLDELMQQGTQASAKGQELLDRINQELPQARRDIARVSAAMSKLTDDNLEFLIQVLGSDANAMSEYFSGPVQLKEERMYHLDNYGSAMTPFYTVLALWVGCLLLSAMLTVEAEPLTEGKKLRMVEIYFGKMMTFMTLTLLQALVVSVGDKYLLGVTVTNLPLFIAFCLFTSVIFTLIVYSIVSVLESIGKAVCVVFLVLQLAGAGGTFPVEVMPHFYQIMQPYLPFTYAIGALREAISGPLAANVLSDFGMLCLFGAIGLAFGLVLKKPLHPLISWFMRKFKESTISE